MSTVNTESDTVKTGPDTVKTEPDTAVPSAMPEPQSPQPLQGGHGPVRRAATAVARTASTFYRWLGTRPMPVIIALSVITGLVVSSVLLIITTAQLRIAWGGLFNHPGNAMSVTGTYLGNFYAGLFKGAVVDPAALSDAFADPTVANWKRALTPIANTITAAVPLAIAGIGLAICFRSAAFNIGAHAQIIAGGLGASLVGFSFPEMAWFPHVMLAFLAAIVGGALCGLIPGLLRTLTGASEVIVTIMMNYVMTGILLFLLSGNSIFKIEGRGVDNPVGKATVPSAQLTPMFDAFPVNAGVIIAILVIIFAALLLNRSRLGFEMQIAGNSSRAAAVAGVKRNAVFVSAFAISGAVVGLAGAVQVLGVSRQLQTTFGADIGTLAILVAFVGGVKPLGVALAALLYGGLQAGGITAQLSSGVSYQLTSVMQALIVLFVTAPALIAAIYRLRATKALEPRT